ncbi:MAG: 5-(carboxyamino)imidazole ribonucleotide mutase [Pelagibacteraceae bacterium TMED65]|nr:5-(carboxyamino)imidazole ribonucleotide mutase [Rickettsiales bacterium]OUU53158.1 MAG: 5-(carboxyamino)imidazole ribonucleotide mutase [Pelagibacteraceae bacterium TMED65]|tara:strand:+ start:5650 stop:6144 length:495 start_codon:yes stop_codon:yes gene_type:complete
MNNKALVSIVMGSQSDWKTLISSEKILKEFKVSYEKKIVSAHRTPERLYSYAKSLKDNGLEVVIAGAGGAAHLPGMIAAITTLPVLGVPIESKSLKGLDSLLSIVQMPAGIPLPTLAIGKAGAINAALASISILSNKYPDIQKKLDVFRKKQTSSIKKIPKNEK